MFNVVENRRWFFLVSGILAVLSIAALVVSAVQSGWALPLDIESTGTEMPEAAGLATLVAAIIIPASIWWSLRSAPNAFRYGVCAIAVLAHNLLVTCGFYALMGLLAEWKADALFFVAVLAVAGLTAQSTIAVFDRVRENAAARRTEPYDTAVNRSVLETTTRSLSTRLCAIFVLAAILLLGGTTFKPFVASVLAGTIAETYAANFVAAPLLAAWEKAAARRAAARAAAY